MLPFLSLLMSGVSTGLSIFGGMSQAAGQKAQSAALQEEEKARNQQMQLDFQRQRIEAVRGAIISSSMATAAAANQGALHTSSYISGKSATVNQGAYQQEGLQQNLGVGNEIFAARQDYYNAGGQISFGQGLSTLGGAVAGNIDNLSRLGSFASGLVNKSSTSQSSGSDSTPIDTPITIGALY